MSKGMNVTFGKIRGQGHVIRADGTTEPFIIDNKLTQEATEAELVQKHPETHEQNKNQE